MSAVGRSAAWWAKGRARPFPRSLSPAGWWLAAGDGLYLSLLIALAAFNAAGPERFWAAALNLYLPQWLWAIPGLCLLAIHLRWAWRWSWIPLLALAWVFGPQMGFRWSMPGQTRGPRLRVMTYNVDGKPDTTLAHLEVLRADPDLLFLQEAAGDVPWLSEWQTAAAGQIRVASRTALAGTEVRGFANSPAWRTYLRSQVRLDEHAVTLYNLHLDTPREGLGELRSRRLGGVRAFERNTETRLAQAASVRHDLTKERGPLIVAGDLNAPEPSLICRAFLHLGLRDAFSLGGRGYGYTYGQRLALGLHQSFVRIDHIMVSRHWTVERCWTGGDAGNSHRPVVADLVLGGP